MPTIEIKDLCVNYTSKNETVEAVRHFNGVFPDGINVIIGYSGCGKTTLLRSILDLVNYDGEISLDGRDLLQIPTKDRGFSFVSQEYVLYPHMTIFENIAFPLQMIGADRNEIIRRVNRVAELTGLTPCLTRKPKHISGGQQQRVAIARAFVKNPAVCLMDEPLSNIDPKLRYMARKQIRDLVKETGCMVIYVTHDLPEALALADRLFVMDEGQLVLCGDPQEVFQSDDPVMRSLREGSGIA